MFLFAVNGSEDIDVLPNGLAIISSVSWTYPVFVITIILRVVQVGTIFWWTLPCLIKGQDSLRGRAHLFDE